MLQKIKAVFNEKIGQPLAKITRPVTRPLVYLLEPLGDVLRPLKENMDARWAGFATRFPIASVWIRRASKGIAALCTFYIIFISGLFGEIPTVAELKEMQTLNTSEVYTADSVLIGKFYKENRKDVAFERINRVVIDALVATEDERFWEHSGIDIWALGRVFWRSILQGDESSGGGSTISQQLAKNLFPRRKYLLLSTPINKVREMLVARRLEEAYDKKELLAFYLNTVPFGGNVFGIEMAAKRFFNTTADSLNLVQGATLVGMLKANTIYNPKKNPEKSRERRNIVLTQLFRNQGDPNCKTKLTKADLEAAKNRPMDLDYQVTLNKDNMASYFKEYVRQQMPKLLENYKKEDGTPYDIYKDGLKIYTSIESGMQEVADSVVAERMGKLQRDFDNHWSSGKWWGDDKWLDEAMRKSERWKNMVKAGYSETAIESYFRNTKEKRTLFKWEQDKSKRWKAGEEERDCTALDSIKHYFKQLNTGFVVLDPVSGLVKAWVGGVDFNAFQYDHVSARRQVGSTFKPIVYTAALQNGIRPCEYIKNTSMAYFPDGTTKPEDDLTEEERARLKSTGPDRVWAPNNADGSNMGSYSLEGALTNSVNVVTANLIHRVGVANVQKLARSMGVSSTMQDDYSIALGSADITLYDMIKVYGTFAARGKRPDVRAVLKVTTRDGKLIADFTKDINTNNWEQVLQPYHADMMTRMMRSVVERGTAGRLGYTYDLENVEIAGKTGTTQNHADGWFMCYTPNLVCGAWVGGINQAVRFRDMDQGQGAYTALPICGLFLQALYKDPRYAKLKEAKFPKPDRWVTDSMDCAQRIYSLEEQAELDSMRIRDSIQNVIPAFPQEQPTGELDNSLRENDLSYNFKEKIGEKAIVAPVLNPRQAPQPTPHNRRLREKHAAVLEDKRRTATL